MRVNPMYGHHNNCHHNNNNSRSNHNCIYNAKNQTSSSSATSWSSSRRTPWCVFIATLLLVFIANHHQVGADASPPNGAGGSMKGLRMRSPKIAHIHVLQAVAESLPKNENQQKETEEEKNNNNDNRTPMGKYEIRSVSGEPNYKSVNLTWEVEFVPSPNDIVTNSSNEIEPPMAFQLFFCELQSFGPHRCRSKVVNATKSAYDNNEDNDLEVVDKIRQIRQYVAQVDNLRMATKYSFHIRSVPKHRQLKKVTGRSEIFDNEIEGSDFLSSANLGGPTIVIPTKGFSAQATRCLPNASEIEVETGPNFGGKIVVDGGNCGVKGNPNDVKDKYVMRIDHKACGSMVKPETNTVETFITVQENLGIFTHSTRRFVVVCSYQSGMQTVRASFSVPGRGGAVAAAHESIEEEERMGRGLKPFRFVDKSELILKENDVDTEEAATQSSEETEALVQEMDNPTVDSGLNQTEVTVATTNHEAEVAGKNHHQEDEANEEEDATNAVAILENIIPGVNEDHIRGNEPQQQQQQETSSVPAGEDDVEISDGEKLSQESDDANKENIENEHFSAKFAKLILERNDRDHELAEGRSYDGAASKLSDTPTGRAFGTMLELISSNMGSVLLTVMVSVILIGVCVYILYRETSKPAAHMSAPTITPPASAVLPRHQHLKELHHHHRHQQHTLPRTLTSKHEDLMA
ncbi:uncharacterized protein LOC101900435 [Musca domestica]|uniref:Uncharacterized protein LOC101900435 n=1 Tax=Musca domestica TaxID=7370 RepID=A0ABM3V2D9_MUSDO|nr:uncharacterized protein LOC101900435 [Musca domestica]